MFPHFLFLFIQPGFMKKSLLLLIIFCSTAGFSQDSIRSKKRVESRKLIPDISTVKKIEEIKDSAIKSIKIAEEKKIEEKFPINVEAIEQIQKEQKTNKKNAALIRFGLGVAFLVLLIIGLRRRKK